MFFTEISLCMRDIVHQLYGVLGCSHLHLFRYSILPALSSKGLVYAKIKAGPFNGDSFLQYIEELFEHMNLYPAL